MSDRPEISEAELHAFVDGALDTDHLADVESRLRRDPQLFERALALRADKEMLKRVFGPLSERPIPPAWLAVLHAAPEPRRLSWRLVGSIAAALILGVFGTLTFQSLERPKTNGIVDAALEARSAAGGAIISVSGQKDMQRYDGMLSAAVTMPVKVPDMARLGYALIGIRLYQAAGAAELLYRDGHNQLFTLYLRKSNGGMRFDQFEHDGLRVCVWQDEELGTVMVGNVSTAAMQRLASLAYTGLTL